MSTSSRPSARFTAGGGAIETAEETAAIFKTTNERADALIARIANLHSYDVPCIVTWPIDKITSAYANWVEDSVG